MKFAEGAQCDRSAGTASVSEQQTPGVSDGQGDLACCSPWGRKESDMTERLNWTELDTDNVCSSLNLNPVT